MAETTIITESIELVENTLNREKRSVDVVLIRPGWSENGRYYSRDVLAKAAKLYENARAFADHQALEDIRAGKPRSVKDITGRYSNVRVGANGELLATRVVYENDAGNAVWPAIVDAVENRVMVAGLSHTAVGKTSKGKAEDREGEIVEDISAVHSVDDVVSPAAGGEYVALTADTNSLKTAVLESLSFEEWQAARPEFVESLKKQNQRVRQTEQERAARAELEAVQATIAGLEKQLAETQAALHAARSDLTTARETASRAEQMIALERALRAVALPPQIEEQVRERIEKAAPDQWKAIVEDAKQMRAALANATPPVTGAPQRVYQPPNAPQQKRGITAADMARVTRPEDLDDLLKQL